MDHHLCLHEDHVHEDRVCEGCDREDRDVHDLFYLVLLVSVAFPKAEDGSRQGWSS